MQKQDVFLLLKQWCDALLKYQIRDAGNKIFDGALLCPACMKIHGRCHDAVYPFLYMADATKDEKYIRIAEKLFRWGDNLFCDDDSFYSDSQHAWNGTTIFSVVGYWEILNYHKEILSAQFARDIEERMRKAADWIYRTFCGKVETNINYYAAASAALSLVAAYHFEEAAGTDIRQSRESCADDGRKDREHTNWEHRGDKKAEDMLRRARYLKLAKKLADLCMSYVTEELEIFARGL